MVLFTITAVGAPIEMKSSIFWDHSVTELSTCFHAGLLLGLFSDPEDGGDLFLRNVS
jgi:hypothetical protein